MSDVLGSIFEEWKASLRSKDRSKDAVSSNFEELFSKLKNAGSTRDQAHDILQRAVKAHYPPPALARKLYKQLKKTIKDLDKSEKEYVDEWHGSIDDKATQAFCDVFPLPRFDEDSEPKAYGNMSKKEYKAQRKYAEQFPVLDTTELEKRMKEQEYDLDIEDMIEAVLGDEDNG